MTPPSLAVIGAGGFIGAHAVERLHADGWKVRAVARTRASLTAAERIGVEGRIADATDASGMTAALAGCEVVLHAIAADAWTIRQAAEPSYQGAARAGCRRIVYLSSAVVHGQAPPAGTTELTPLPRGQRLAYNLAKRAAEDTLFRLASSGPVEVTALRPGIVFGPGSRWIEGLAEDLRQGRAGLADGGAGLCNAIYVDNLIHAVRLAATSPEAMGQAFLLGDAETPSWREFYRRVAEAAGVPFDGIPTVSGAAAGPLRSRVHTFFEAPVVQQALERLPRRSSTRVRADLETALLHRARHTPDWSKARTLLGYAPEVPPEEAWRRTLDWLRARSSSAAAP